MMTKRGTLALIACSLAIALLMHIRIQSLSRLRDQSSLT
jgi:HAMP domain-containing protein